MLVFWGIQGIYSQTDHPTFNRILKSNADEIVIEFIPKPYVDQRIEVEGKYMTRYEGQLSGQISEPGKPMLPIEGYLVALHPNKKPIAELLESNFEVLENQDIAPAPFYTYTEEGEAIENYKIDEFFYETHDHFYPLAIFEMGEKTQLRDQTVIKILIYPIQYNPARKLLRKATHLKIRIRFVDDTSQIQKFPKIISEPDPHFEPFYKNLIINYKEAINWRNRKPEASIERSSDSTANWFQLNRAYYRIPIGEDGLYRLTYSYLLNYGIDLTQRNNATAAIYNNGKSIPLRVETTDPNPQNWYFEFFAQRRYGINSYFNNFSDTSIYWITWNDGDPKRYVNDPFSSTEFNDTIKWFFNTLHREEDKNYFFGVTQSEIQTTDDVPGEGWFWSEFFSGTTRDFTFTIDTVQRMTGSLAQIKVRLHGMTICTGGTCVPPSRHNAQFFINNTLLGELSWTNNTEGVFDASFSDNLLKTGTNTLRVRSKSWSSADSNITKFYLDWFKIIYPRPILITGGILKFQSPVVNNFARLKFFVNGITPSNATVFDLSNGRRLTALDSLGVNTFTFTDTLSSQREYLIVAQTGRLIPSRLESKNFTNLRVNHKGADYIIITHQFYRTEADRLAQHRASLNKLKTIVVDVQDIYDEFNFGHLDPVAIRTFLKHSYYYWKKPSPTYVLLFGDATWDFKRNLTSSIKSNFVPSYGNPPSDNALVSFDNTLNFIPYMLIGRAPVENLQQANQVVNKLIAYDNPPVGVWNKSFLFITGGNTTSEKFIFNYWSNDLINKYVTNFPIGGTAHKVYKTTDAIIDGENKPLLRSLINNGLIFVNFIGHSGGRIWGVDVGSPYTLQNINGQLPFISSVSCNVGAFSDPRSNVLSEDFFLADNRGGIAAWASSGLGVGSIGRTLVDKLLSAITRDYARSLGLLTTLSRIHFWVVNQSNSPTVVQTLQLHPLIGDPATAIAIPLKPDFQVSNDDLLILNNPPISDSTVTLKIKYSNLGIMAGSQIKGLIRDQYTSEYYHTEKTYNINIPITLKDFAHKDSITITLDVRNKPGTHLITFQIDPQDSIGEIRKDNNIAQQTFYIYQNNITTVKPLPYSVISSTTPQFTVTTPAGSDTAPLVYSFEIDTVRSFDSPAKISSPVVIPTKVSANWQSPPLATNKIYYWRSRASTASHLGAWASSSFQIAPTAPTLDTVLWRQSSTGQWIDNSGQLISLTDSGVTMYIGDSTRLYARSVGSRYNMVQEFYSILEINTQRANGYWWADAYSFLAGWYDPSNGVGRLKGFDLLKAGSVDSMINFLSTVPSGNYVMLSVVLNGRQNVTEALYQQIEQLGSVHIRSLQAGHSWILISRKGVGVVVEDYKPTGISEFELILGNIYSRGPGKFLSQPIGPASKWIRCSWNTILSSSQTQAQLSVLGIKQSSEIDTLFTISAPETQIDLSTVSSITYPMLQLLARLSNTDGNTTPVLKQWSVSYLPPADLAISAWTFRTVSDSVQFGKPIQASIDVFNIGYKRSDSAVVRLFLQENPSHYSDAVIQPIETGQYRRIESSLTAIGTLGLQRLFARILITEGSNDLWENNNLVGIPIFIKSGVSAIQNLTILFDNREICNGDYVSAQPKITLRVCENENNYSIDLTKLRVVIDNQEIPSIALLEKVTRSLHNPLEELEFQWSFSDGEHQLEVFADSVSEYVQPLASLRFKVKEQMQLLNVYNYPNPFSDKTSFTFTLTGRTIPNKLQIKIYTITGRLIQNLTLSQNELQMGINRIIWDGRDQDGDEIANGYYLYKVIVQSDEETQEIVQKLAKLK